MTAFSSLDEIVHHLSRDPNLLRIKKLLLYASHKTWESDLTRLDQLDLTALIEGLMARYATLEALQGHLNSVVQTLTKPAEYTLIANGIVTALKPLYVKPEPVATARHAEYQAIAHELEHHAEHLRIKKLMYSASYSRWENDPARLAQVSMVDLVQTLHTLTQTVESLAAVLSSIVQTLNRRTEYAAIAQVIIAAFARLEAVSPASDHTQIVTGIVTPLPPLPQEVAIAPGVFEPSASAPDDLAAESLTDPTTPPHKPLDLTNLFDLRLELMKYTNPLRAKMLLFAQVVGLDTPTSDGWSRLKAYTLDDLLRSLVTRYTQLSDLERALHNTAQQLPEPGQGQAVVGAIARILKPYYPNDQLSLVPTDSALSSPSLGSSTPANGSPTPTFQPSRNSLFPASEIE